MKRQLRTVEATEETQRLAAAAALALLERSVRMRHRRLAVLRLKDALALGAGVPADHWLYCRDAAVASRDADVRALFALAERAMRTALGTEVA